MIEKPKLKSIDPDAPLEEGQRSAPSKGFFRFMTHADIADIARRALDQFPSMTVDQLAGHIEAAQVDIKEIVKGLTNRDAANVAYRVMLNTTVAFLRAREERIKLELRVAELENAPKLSYRGPWKARTAYASGSFVTFAGSVWHSNENDNSDKPGASDAWTLAAKRGRDGSRGKREGQNNDE